MTARFVTVGHSDRDLAEFIADLRDAGVQALADVRKMPGSSTFPHFDGPNLATALEAAGIEDQHLPQLGGLRRRSRAIPEQTNANWRNRSFHNYADHALTPEFRDGLATLIEAGQDRTTAMMCAEAAWDGWISP